jgi:hypothetical protein
MSILVRSILLLVLLAGILPTSAIAQVDASPGPPAAAVEEAYFPEDHGEFSALDNLREAIATKLALSRSRLGATTKGIFERAHAWTPGSTLIVCFYDGDPSVLQKVADIAREWNYNGSPVSLDLGTPPRSCRTGGADIKVRIVEGSSWSPIGRRSRSAVMRLGVVPPGGLSDAKFRQIVLHEFGHALGLWHELKHASGRCWNEFKADELTAFYRRTYNVANEQSIRDAIETFDPVVMAADFSTTDFDRDSVMMYAFPAHVYRSGNGSPCWAPLRETISSGDKETLRLAMRNPVVAASQLASLTASLDTADKRLADAFNALLLAGDTTRDRLLRVAERLPPTADASTVASSILVESERLSIRAFGRR